MGHPGEGAESRYLCVDDYMRDVVGARALSSAFELGLVDHLLQHQPCVHADLAARSGLDQRGLKLLLGLLQANRAVEQTVSGVRLSASFSAALEFRDLLEAKLDFANLLAADFLDLFTSMLARPDRFFSEARVFELFSYQRCLDPGPENHAATARWMRFTTALTKYEAQACLAHHDFSRYRRMLDVGGNSGEFALRVCRRHAGIRATVYDLPMVCEIGASHVGSEPEANRIDFVKVDPAGQELPRGYDLVTFKSMLHDWPEEEARQFIRRAYHSLDPGGTLLIFERGPIEVGEKQLPYSQIPLLLFFRSYRSAEDYRGPLLAAGFRDLRLAMVNLDMPFMLLAATK